MACFVAAMQAQNVHAEVVDFDHYRIHGGMAVETDYIISVKPKESSDLSIAFEEFKISKTYRAFRSMASSMKGSSEKNLKHGKNLTTETKLVVQYAQSVYHFVDSQKTQYLGKVNYTYVKSLAKQRSQVLNDALATMLNNFPTDSSQPTTKNVLQLVQTFFLTDHVEEQMSERESDESYLINKIIPSSLKKPYSHKKYTHEEQKAPPALAAGDTATPLVTTPRKKSKVSKSLTSPVVPLTRKQRRSLAIRTNDDQMLQQVGEDANLFLDDARTQSKLVPSYSSPVPTVSFSEGNKLGKLIEESPVVFLAIAIIAVIALKHAERVLITVDLDIALLLAFSWFCVGLHMPRPSQGIIDAPAVAPKPQVAFSPSRPSVSRDASFTIRRSMLVSPKASFHEPSKKIVLEPADAHVMEGEDDPLIQSPMLTFPEGAELGSHLNCWSQPHHEDFKVRGPKYLSDKKKMPSQEFLFPARGVDLFLTDTCPENVGSNSGVLGGNLRDKPTFLINFRLPWGVLVFYFEIPPKFVPFVRKKYEFEYDEELPDLNKMTPGDRTACRFLLADQSEKDELLKIVPIVIAGPWIVKSVVGGKPAILGNKLPVNYVYQKQEGTKALYLEADLDIVASSAARGILSVVRSHTQSLTLDLGFVVQANHEDELPEQMLVGVRCHGMDPLNAPPLPPMTNTFNFEDIDTSVES